MKITNPFRRKKEKAYGAIHTPKESDAAPKARKLFDGSHRTESESQSSAYSKSSSFGKTYQQFPVAKPEQIAVPTEGPKSSDVNRTSYLAGGYFASDGQYREYPIIPFNQRFDYYFTVGKVQNVVDSMATDITNRRWYFKDTTDGGKGGAYHKELKDIEHWGKHTIQVSQLFTEVIVNWTIGGTYIVSPLDWIPIQLRSIRAKIRDVLGNTKTYIQVINGREKFLDASQFIEVPYNNIDRLAWGVGLFDSLMNDRWTDIDGRQPISTLDLHRQIEQDHGKIIHKHSNPLDIYIPAEGESVSQETIDNDIMPLIGGAKPGDALVINKRLEVLFNKTDGNSRFKEYKEGIEEEIEAGLQSSKNRLLTNPSAMADAREAGEQDDDRILGIMERLRILMNKHIIPQVLGIDSGWIEFEWGEKDAFNQQMPTHIMQALQTGVMTPEEARQKLEDEHDWHFPELNEKNKQLAEDRKETQSQALTDQLTDQELKNNEEALIRYRMERAEIKQRSNLLKKYEEVLEEYK